MKKSVLAMLLCAATSIHMFAGVPVLAEEATETATEAADEDYGTVTIQNGERTLTFTEMPKAVMTFNTCASENMAMLGLEDYMVGRNVPSNEGVKLHGVARNSLHRPIRESMSRMQQVLSLER